MGATLLGLLLTHSSILGAEVPKREAAEDWRVTAGLGAGIAPIYEGSEDYAVTPAPFLEVTWKERISLGVGGLTATLLKFDAFEAGIGLGYHPGRDDDGDSLFGWTDDDTLQGMGDVDGAWATRAYAAYDFGVVKTRASVTRFIGNDNDGLLVGAVVSVPLRPTAKMTLTPSFEATWADQEYMETFFGVSEAQSVRSRFARFDADAGMKNVGIAVNAIYMMGSHWHVFASGRVAHLLADAADSPISEEDVSGSLSSGIGYRF